MDWYDISDDSWLEAAFGDVNSDGYFDVSPEEPALTDLYVGSPEDDSVDPEPAATDAPSISAFGEQSDTNCWMLSDDPDARGESDQYGLPTITPDTSNGWFLTNTGQMSAPPW